MDMKRVAAVSAMLAALISMSGRAQAPKPDTAALAKTGILERLAERSGVYGVPPTAKVPGFIADAGWPQKLPNNWIIGEVGGLYVAPDDHIWVYQRPRSLTNDEAALTPPTHKAPDGRPVDVLGYPRPYGVLGDCCLPAPSVMEFDANGKLLQAWGGPADPGKCRIEDGCMWPAREHGIFVDHNGFVYIGGNGGNGKPNGSAWASTAGADGMILKFTKEGKFVMMIGGPTKGADSNNKDGGKNAHAAVLPAGRPHGRSDDQPPVCVRRLRQSPRGHRRCGHRQIHRPFRRLRQQPGRRQGCRRRRSVDERLHEGQHEAGVLPHAGALREDQQGRPDLRLRSRQQPHTGLQRPRSRISAKSARTRPATPANAGSSRSSRSPSRPTACRARRFR